MNFLKKIFGTKQPARDSKIASNIDDGLAAKYLLNILNEKMLQGEIADNTLILKDIKTTIKVWISDKKQHPGAMIVQLNFKVNQENIDDELAESLAGIGENTETAIENGVRSFFNGVFLALFESFKETHNPDIDFGTKWNEKELIWHPKVGALQVNGDPDEPVDENRIYNLIKEDIKVRLGKSRFYWIKVFVAKQVSGEIQVECTFNNEKFYQAEEKIKEYAQRWECSRFKIEKQCIIIRQCDKTWMESKYSASRYRDVISKTIELMENCNSELDHDSLFERICKVTMDIDLAFELYCFIPEVYCRLLFPVVTYSDEVIINIQDGKEYKMSVNQFESYWQIKKFVQEKINIRDEKNNAMKVLCISANFNALNNALNQGSQLENLAIQATLLNAFENYNPMR